MKVDELISRAKDSITVKRVYGEPYERDGSRSSRQRWSPGAEAGGSGHDESGGDGEGGGFGMAGRPAGVFVIKGDEVTWHPAVDPNRMATVAGLVAIVWLATRALSRRRG